MKSTKYSALKGFDPGLPRHSVHYSIHNSVIVCAKEIFLSSDTASAMHEVDCRIH